VLIIFSISLPVILSKTMGQKDLGVLYASLLGLGMMTEVAVLKWEDQYLYLIQAFTIQVIFLRHLLSVIKGFRCCQEI